MTCVVGIRGIGTATIGFDSCAASGGEITSRLDQKGGMLADDVAFGYTWSYRYGQIIQHHLSLPPVSGDEYKWVVQEFVPAMREALSQHGFLKRDGEREESGQLIIAVRDRIFCVESDHGVGEPRGRFATVGSGREYALGALYALDAQVQKGALAIPDDELAVIALREAARSNAYVRSPWHVHSTSVLVEA